MVKHSMSFSVITLSIFFHLRKPKTLMVISSKYYYLRYLEYLKINLFFLVQGESLFHYKDIGEMKEVCNRVSSFNYDYFLNGMFTTIRFENLGKGISEEYQSKQSIIAKEMFR